MLTMEQLIGQKVFQPRPASKKTRTDGTPAAPKRIGKVHNLVFSPDGLQVVGLLVKRPDVAGMIKREDLFVPLSGFTTFEGGLLIKDGTPTDEAAAKALRLDLDKCIIWGGMDVVSQDGASLGYVADCSFDWKTGALGTLYVTDGAMAATRVGSVPLPANLLVGYSKGTMVVKPEAAQVQLTGGIMAKAGEGFGQAQVAGKKAAAKAGKVAGDALDKGSFALGRALGSAKRSLSEALADDEEEAPAAPAKALDVQVEKPPAPQKLSGETQTPTPPTYAPASASKTSSAEKPSPARAGASSKDSKARAAATPKAPGTKPEASKPSGLGASAGKKKAAPQATTADKAAKAVGKQLGRTKGMFKSFLKEFDEASK